MNTNLKKWIMTLAVICITAFFVGGYLLYREKENVAFEPKHFGYEADHFAWSINFLPDKVNSQDWTSEIYEEKNLSVEAFKELKVQMDVGEIILEESEDDFLHVEYRAFKQSSLKVKKDESQSLISLDAKIGRKSFFNSFFGSSSLTPVLVVKIPSTFNESLEIEQGVGSIHIALNQMDSTSVSMGVGDLSIQYREMDKGELDVSVGVGDVSIKLPKVHHVSLHSEVGVGSISLGSDFDQVNRQGVLVSDKVSAQKGQSTYLLTVEVGTGNIDIK